MTAECIVNLNYMPRKSEEEQPQVLNCPKCGASLAKGAIGCGYCQSEFVQAAGTVAEKQVESLVIEKDGRKVVGEISFNRWAGLNDPTLVALAFQIAEATPKILAAKPSGQKAYTNFTLPLPIKSGRPDALLAEVFTRDDRGFDVCLSAGFPRKTHQWVQAEGRILKLPDQA